MREDNNKASNQQGHKMKELKEKMMKVAENLNLEGLKELWEKTNRMGRDAGCLALRDVVMTILENRYG